MLEQMAGLFYIAMVVTRLVGMRTARTAARDAALAEAAQTRDDAEGSAEDG